MWCKLNISASNNISKMNHFLLTALPVPFHCLPLPHHQTYNNRSVRRFFRSKAPKRARQTSGKARAVVDGRVIAHVPQNADGDEALWKVRHFEDGDLEDLDETEFLRASSAYEKDLTEPLNGFPYDDEIVAMQIAQKKSHCEGGGQGRRRGRGRE